MAGASKSTRLIHRPRRHPLCPQCGYDLVATVEANRRVCPECGLSFSPGDLRLQRLPGDWTIGRGIRRAAAGLLARSLIAAPLLAGLVTLLGPWLDLAMGWRGLLVLAVAGAALGGVLGHGLAERAGFASALVAVEGSLFAWGVAVAGVAVGGALAGVSGPMQVFAVVVTTGFATGVIVKAAALGE